MTDGDYIYHGEHKLMYRIVESICGTPETNTTLYVNLLPFTKKCALKSGRIFFNPSLLLLFTNILNIGETYWAVQESKNFEP